ncbi:response regulator [Streptomonospora litoralis]|uniref:Transcriptional regulatory protein DegU n=1 Tax=Streptomonospora litoralis TaxID=2498135 RepID=A0A4P6Q701_9ACTN|nr:response regulator transcription factor [Streptomonospora litoralis]QBI55201.1 Transcriptional regulatory protein DegU [Streptomonospora litoralis]
MTAAAVRVLIVDDQILLRQGLRKLLEVEEGVRIVGDARDGVAALDFLDGACEGALPDVALVDARMPRMDGVALIERMAAQYPGVAAVVLTTFDDDDYIFGGMRAGAKGYLLKDTPPDELVAAIRRAARGETVLGGAAAERIVGALLAGPADSGAGEAADSGGGAEPTPGSPAEAGLSERELEVARLVGTGAANREIARGLFITEGTAKNHVTSILRKLGLRDRTQLAVWVNRRPRD